MATTPDAAKAADLLERLLTDPAFRNAFRRAPAEAAAAAGLADVAEELQHPARALQTLEIRESKSSLAGVFMAAASEGIGVAQFVGFLHARGSLDGPAASALNGALERASVQNAVAAGPVAVDPIDAASAGSSTATDAPPPEFQGVALDAPAAAAPGPAASEPPTGAGSLFAEPAEAAAAPDPAPLTQPATFDDPSVGQALPVADPPAAAAAAVAEPAAAPAAAVVDVVAPPAAAGRPVAPLDPSDMTGSNAGGKLHGSEFNIADAEGAPGPNGRIHAGYDLFGKGNAPIRAPADGEVIEIKDTGRTSGQVFGAAVKIRMADGRVWVFRHVSARVSVGDTVHAGDVFASITPWTDGPPHTHIELWKTFAGGYNADNMEDPLDELKRAYEGGADAAGTPAQAGAVVAAVVEQSPAAGGKIEAVVKDVSKPVTAVSVARNDQIEWDGTARDRLKMTVDPRVLVILDALAKVHPVKVGAVTHDGFDLIGVDGKPVGADNPAARDLVEALATLEGSLRPTSVGSPWRVAADGFYSDQEHAGNLHVRLPAAGFVDAAPGPQSVQFLRAVDPAASPGADTPAIAAEAFAGGGENPYPGDGAEKWQLAQWMAREAVKAGLPPELPVMASLQESSLTNDPTPDEYGSIGYFQLIPTWGAERETPQAQLHWFIRQAVELKAKRLEQGFRGFGENPAKYWEWIADVERPAERFRHEYAKRLPEAQGLLEEAGAKAGVPKEKLFAAATAAVDGGVAGSSAKARTAIAAAMGQLGVDYAWGGGGPSGPGRGFDQGAAYVGFDCSSLMQYALSKAGIDLQRVAQAQYDMPSGKHIDAKHLQPGDLLFFGGQRSIHHVAMYIGNGKFIHAPHTGDKIKISELAGYYMSEFAGARRFT